jgi:hypothetical protein
MNNDTNVFGDLAPVRSAHFSSVWNGEDRLFVGGPWASASRRVSWAEGVFAVPYDVKQIKLAMAGSDVTADQSRIQIFLRQPDGGYAGIFQTRDKGIMRGMPGTMSPGVLPKVGFTSSLKHIEQPLNIQLDEPVRAIAVMLQIEGHGWFAARDLACFGDAITGKVPPLTWRDATHSVSY